MISLAYVSLSCIAGDIARILELQQTAIRNNRKSGVTGCLYTDAGFFYQVLEGSRSAIDATFQRICADDRHTDIQVLHREGIETRTFGDWALKMVNGISNPYLAKTFDCESFRNADRMYIHDRTEDLLRL